MAFIQGMSNKDMAAVFGVSEGSVKQQIFRARAAAHSVLHKIGLTVDELFT